MKFAFAFALVCLPLVAVVGAAAAQEGMPSPYGAPEHQWASPPSGQWGSTAGIERGPHGEIWAIDRCGANSCDGSDKAPIIQLDMNTGKTIKAIGAGLFVFPHGLHVDRAGNIWVTDGAISKDGSKGLQVTKLSPAGKVLMTLGVAGQRGDDDTHFQSPSDVITAPNGDIFVTDGHAPIAPFIPGQSGHAGDEVFQGRQVHQAMGQGRRRARASSTTRTLWRWTARAGFMSPTG